MVKKVIICKYECKGRRRMDWCDNNLKPCFVLGVVIFLFLWGKSDNALEMESEIVGSDDRIRGCWMVSCAQRE